MNGWQVVVVDWGSDQIRDTIIKKGERKVAIYNLPGEPLRGSNSE